ncbi:TrmH family RNA methyltransferase [Microbacterium sp. 22242]|uniref:TrmH family RNA methyltransferase n=1 Tax=Microbacterium sp. 22242 TaxID=3453896 RepID=UPI003F83DD1E
MHEFRIHEPADPRLDDYRGLTDLALRARAEARGGLYIAESFKVIDRAIGAGHRPRSVLTQERWLPGIRTLLAGTDTPVYVADDAVVEAVAGFRVHRGALAAMHRPALPDPAELLAGLPARARVAVLEDLVEHANVGALIRSAAALGVDAVLVTPRCADPLYRRAIKVSMGTVFQVPWTRIDPWPAGVELLHRAGFVVAGMSLGEGAIPLDDLVARDHDRLALVFGSEGPGLAPDTERLLDARVTIPMAPGIDSLNVAAASAVAFYATR